jgi:hypothetical protein
MAERTLKDLVAEAVNEIITDGKLQIQDTNGDKIEDLDIAYVEEDIDNEDIEEDEEDSSEEEEDE